MGPGSAPPPPVGGPPPALGSASQGLQGSLQPPPPPPLAVSLPGMQGSGRAAPPTGLAAAPGPASQGLPESMAVPHVARPPPPGRPGAGPVSHGFQGSVPLPSMRSSLSATAALPAVDAWLAACKTLASAIESVLQPAQQQVMAVRLASVPEPPTVSADPTRFLVLRIRHLSVPGCCLRHQRAALLMSVPESSGCRCTAWSLDLQAPGGGTSSAEPARDGGGRSGSSGTGRGSMHGGLSRSFAGRPQVSMSEHMLAVSDMCTSAT